jgi:hypothetical protein
MADREQPWAKEGNDTRPPDRAFFRDLLDRREQLEMEREERLRRTLHFLPLYFMLWSVGASIVLGVLYLFAFRAVLCAIGAS